VVGLYLAALLTQIRSYCVFTAVDDFEEKLYINKGKNLSVMFEN